MEKYFLAITNIKFITQKIAFQKDESFSVFHYCIGAKFVSEQNIKVERFYSNELSCNLLGMSKLK